MHMLESLATAWWYAAAWFAGLAGFSVQPADLVAAAAVVAVAGLALAVAIRLLPSRLSADGHRTGLPAAALRERIRRRSVPRHCDPNARGHRRPRAPSLHPSAA